MPPFWHFVSGVPQSSTASVTLNSGVVKAEKVVSVVVGGISVRNEATEEVNVDASVK